MTFSDLNLNTPLLNALDDLGFTQPTTIQDKTFAVTMAGRDVCGIAQTGTGKTFAYLLPLLRLWKFSKSPDPQIVILVPTRELVMQVVEAARALGKYLSLQVTGVYGGVNINTQALEVEQGMDILVGTPGRLYDLVMKRSVKINAAKKLVIDEMDEMLNLGFRPQIRSILELMQPKRQNLLFSATITPEVETFMAEYFNNPERVEAAPAGTPLANIEQRGYEVPNFYTKINFLKYLLQDAAYQKVLLFVSTKKMADELFDELTADFEGQTGIIHSNKEQNFRFNSVKQFKEGRHRFLIATDIVARGLDIAGVSHVINFDLPETPENYIHRIGRTGRADRKGIAISLMSPMEQEERTAIEALMQMHIPVIALPEDVEISTVLTDDEMPKVHMRNILVKPVKREEGGGAFHEKSARNSRPKVKQMSHKEKMMKKYGKPKKRKPKR
jgi:ATP-dependent RNA helicase RhlE